MRVRVGPFEYAVRLVRGMIRHEGEDCYGLCDNHAQVIYLSDVPPEDQRLRVFFHELMHAWWYHFTPDPADEEAVVDLVGLAMTDFVMQAARQWPRGLGDEIKSIRTAEPWREIHHENTSGALKVLAACVSGDGRRVGPPVPGWQIRFYGSKKSPNG